ncbi:hypothetical protein CAP39_12490 [Sphingomonas sp. IBVSS1]|nr:hypothetical protein CAP39_12490 [Sphingomonas sp. IBVSS1]
MQIKTGMMMGVMLASLAVAAPAAAQWQQDGWQQQQAAWDDGENVGANGRWADAGWNDRRGWNDQRGWNDRRGWGQQAGWNDGRGGQYCRRSDGTTGTLAGAAVGGVIGSELSRRGSRTQGAVLGAVVGGLLGRSIDRGRVVCR